MPQTQNTTHFVILANVVILILGTFAQVTDAAWRLPMLACLFFAWAGLLVWRVVISEPAA